MNNGFEVEIGRLTYFVCRLVHYYDDVISKGVSVTLTPEEEKAILYFKAIKDNGGKEAIRNCLYEQTNRNMVEYFKNTLQNTKGDLPTNYLSYN